VQHHPGLLARLDLQAAQRCICLSCPQDEDQEGQRRRQPKPGEAGFRYHAAIPQVKVVVAMSSLLPLPHS
jgi:hypothetical protein